MGPDPEVHDPGSAGGPMKGAFTNVTPMPQADLLASRIPLPPRLDALTRGREEGDALRPAAAP